MKRTNCSSDPSQISRTDEKASADMAADIDPGYAAAFARAAERGVESLCYACAVSPEGIFVTGRLPIDPPAPAD